MSTFYLIRHAANDFLGRALAARLPGVHLNGEGRNQASRLADVLGAKGITRIYSSPLERALETAEPLARQLGLEIQIAPEFQEMDFGEWSGRTMQELDQLPQWKLFNTYRSATPAPGGGLMAETQLRFVQKLEQLRLQFPSESIAITSHADPIKSALAYYLGIPLDLFHRLEISPASHSILKLHEYGPEILAVNCPAL